MKKIKKIFKYGFYFLCIAGLFITIIMSFMTPLQDRDWVIGHSRIPSAEINGNRISIKNIRNFKYEKDGKEIADYYDKTFELSKLKSVSFIISHFSGFEGIAHTFLSFEFEGGDFLAMSIEARREKGEEYSPWKGLFHQYEMIYLLGDENDFVKLRTNMRKEKVYLFPAKTTPEKAQKLFLAIMNRINQLKDHPEFYNTLTNNCTNNIALHIEEISDREIPWSYKLLFPGYSDELAYDLDLIPNDQPIEAIREKYRIDEKAASIGDDPAFSVKIREGF